MNTTDLMMEPPGAIERSPAPEAEARPRPALSWGRVALACAILVAAGGGRWWQEQRLKAVMETGKASPFPLKSLPMAIGGWQVPEGVEEALDPEVESVLGCVDYLKRSYVDDRTGVRLEALVLYGPATIAHRPELCYPGAGYSQVDQPRTRTFETPGGPAAFTSLVFAKGEGGASERQAVFYALRYGGRWTVDANYWNFARLPGLYKIQLSRRIGEGERLDLPRDPCESFLEAMLPEFERRLSGRPSASS